MKKILIIVGSQREKSFNKTVGNFIGQQLEGKAEVSFLDFSKLPFFNQDKEFPCPVEVQEVRDTIKEYEALWIVTPEYNGSIPGVLKNALDWISRPVEKGVSGPPEFVKGKPVAITSAGSRGGSGVRPQMEALMKKMALRAMDQSLGIELPKESFVTGEFSLSEEQKESLKEQVEKFIEFIG